MKREQKIKNMVAAFKGALSRMTDQELFVAEIAYEKYLSKYLPAKKKKRTSTEDVGWQA